jgi:hypothetical protein
MPQAKIYPLSHVSVYTSVVPDPRYQQSNATPMLEKEKINYSSAKVKSIEI